MPHKEVPEEAGFVQVPQPDHVVHTVHRSGVHGPQATLNTLGDLVLLEVGFVHTRHQELDRFIFSLIRHTVHTVALSRITVHISRFHCIADLEIGHI